MPTIAAGTTATIRVVSGGALTVTPGTGGRVSLNARGSDGGQAIAPREIYSSLSVAISAGDVVLLEAINVDATYTAPGSGVADASSLTLTTDHVDSGRIPSGALTYTIDASTGWDVSDGMAVWLPASGTISFAVSGGPTINGGTSTLTRALAGNSIGYVVLSRIAGTDAYSLSGA